MTVIRREDFVRSIADGLQYISYYHPPDFLAALAAAHQRERNPVARDAIAQMLINSRLCAEGHRPICQDTGIVVAFVRVGMDVRWDTPDGLEAMINEGVRRAYTHPDNPLRASIVDDPIGTRRNTGDNTPANVHVELVPGNEVQVRLAAKGGGSEAKATFDVLKPSDDIAEWVLEQVPRMGAGWCPPGLLGIGVGGTAEMAMRLAKEACLEPIDIHDLQQRGPASAAEALRLEIFEKVNRLGIGAQGLGGLTTVLDVKVREHASHAALQPVAIVPNCAATRHVEFSLDGSGPAELTPPRLEDWPQVAREAADDARQVDLDRVPRDEVHSWQPGERLLLSGTLLTGRDAAHKRIADMLARGERPPVDFNGRFIYYVGPVDPVGEEPIGPAGPTTATRMDKFTAVMLGETGLLGMIGKAERGPEAVDAIREHGAVYLIAVGGAAYLLSKAIRSSRVLAFEDLGMEAIRELEVADMPVTVAVDARGESIHERGPREWRQRIAGIPVAVE